MVYVYSNTSIFKQSLVHPLMYRFGGLCCTGISVNNVFTHGSIIHKLHIFIQQRLPPEQCVMNGVAYGIEMCKPIAFKEGQSTH